MEQTRYKHLYQLRAKVISLHLSYVFFHIECNDDKEDPIILKALSVTLIVQIFRFFCIILKQVEILALICQIGNKSTNDRDEFIQVNNKLKTIMKIVNAFCLMCMSCIGFIAIIPFFSSDKKLAANIVFPLDWKNSETAFWVTHAYTVVGFIYALFSTFLTLIIWYLLTLCAIKYEVLGNKLRNIGVIATKGTTRDISNISELEQEKLFVQNVIQSIESHQAINQ